LPLIAIVVFSRANISAAIAGQPAVGIGEATDASVRVMQRGTIPATIYAAAVGRDLAAMRLDIGAGVCI